MCTRPRRPPGHLGGARPRRPVARVTDSERCRSWPDWRRFWPRTRRFSHWDPASLRLPSARLDRAADGLRPGAGPPGRRAVRGAVRRRRPPAPPADQSRPPHPGHRPRRQGAPTRRLHGSVGPLGGTPPLCPRSAAAWFMSRAPTRRLTTRFLAPNPSSRRSSNSSPTRLPTWSPAWRSSSCVPRTLPSRASPCCARRRVSGLQDQPACPPPPAQAAGKVDVKLEDEGCGGWEARARAQAAACAAASACGGASRQRPHTA